MKYIALLRGTSIGGASLISMSTLRAYAESFGLRGVQTYANSGNVVFETDRSDIQELAREIEDDVRRRFPVSIKILMISTDQYRQIVAGAPAGWGEKPDWKYNTLFLIPPYNIDEILAEIGELNPDIETLVPGDGVLYHSAHLPSFTRATTSQLASRACYQQMVVRSWDTTQKLLELL